MKLLQNKSTEETGWLYANRGENYNVLGENGKVLASYISLAELCEEWCDYEELKKYWFIDFNGEVKEFELLGFEWQGWMKEIGNYFLSREEAELAVRKLKAWKRLKDKGFRFNGYSHYDWNGNESPAVGFEYSDLDKMFNDKRVVADLDLLFSGEDD